MKLRKDGWWHVQQPHATFGVRVNSRGRVDSAAPIARWTIGKPWKQVSRYYRRKKAILTRLEGVDPPF